MSHLSFPPSLLLPKRIWWSWDQPVASVVFQKEFSLNSALQAVLYLSASGPFQVWLDGQPVPFPPSPFPTWRIMNQAALALGAGCHRLNIQAAPGDPGQPYLMGCLDWVTDGLTTRIPTTTDWLMSANPPQDWLEHPQGVNWQPAWAFDGTWAEPWGMPCNAPDDFCRLGTGWQEVETGTLTQVVSLYQGAPRLGSGAWLGENGRIEMKPALPYPLAPLQLKSVRPGLEWYRIRENHSIFSNVWLQLFEARSPHIVFDVGSESFARLKVRVHSGGPAILAISTGESLQEVHQYTRRVTDIFEVKDGETFATTPTGFRYVKLWVLSSGSQNVHLDALEIQHIRYPVAPRGQFRCSDDLLNQVWDISTRTAHRCMQNEIWDGIKRDQLPWMGDLYTEALAIYHAFGDYRLARHTLAALAEIGPASPRPLAKQLYPGLQAVWKIPGGDINNIPAYTLWWLAGMWDYFLYTGDASLIQEYQGELGETLDHIASWVDESGLWHLNGGWDFIDWAELTPADREIYCHLLATRCMGYGAALFSAVHLNGEKYSQLQQKMIQAARKTWWQDGSGGFGSSHHANSMAIRSGALNPQEQSLLFSRTLTSDTPVSMTYWHRFLDLQAAAQAGSIQWGLDTIRQQWGLSVQMGVSTFWEAFDPNWISDDTHSLSMIGAGYARYGGYETSLCHGWSAGPAAWFHTAILGVSPAAPGFTAINFQPNLGDIDWAEGTIPTPLGDIRVELRKNPQGPGEASLYLPTDMEIHMPPGLDKLWHISLEKKTRKLLAM
jgi:alpha-L-rhamnosidase